MSMRLRRLQADYERLQARCDRSPFLLIRSTKGNPPERYEIAFAVKGLSLDSRNQIVETTEHIAEIVLTSGYPRQAPQCRMLTPIFHPNIDAASICIGDHWAASESLDDLAVRIAEIITFQSYNTKSPLNGEAARWADQNESLLPIDSVDLWPADEKRHAVESGSVEAPAKNMPACVNCGATGARAALESDAGGRWICHGCTADCPKCSMMLVVGEKLCVKCLRKAAKFVEHSREAINQRDAAKAHALLEAGMREYPSAEVLHNEMQVVSAIVEQINRTTNALKQVLREHKYYAARGLVARLAEMPVQVRDLGRAREVVDANCAKAAALGKRGLLEANNDVVLGEALLRRALQVCADYPDAQEGLRRLEEKRKSIPQLEDRFLRALASGKATAARESLTPLLQLVPLPADAKRDLLEQVQNLERTGRLVRGILVAAGIAAVLIALVAAVTIGTGSS